MAQKRDSQTVFALIGNGSRETATVYQIDAKRLADRQDQALSSADVAAWIRRKGKKVYEVSYCFAYGIGGEG